MLRIGLTGGIGAGKSTVSAVFSECGGVIVDGDVIAREVVEPGTEGLRQLVEAFGERIGGRAIAEVSERCASFLTHARVWIDEQRADRSRRTVRR